MIAEEGSVIQPVRKSPFLLKTISILIFVEGVIGFLFFTTILIYQSFNSDFLSGWEYGQYSGSSLYLILSMYSVVHLGLILSSVLLLKYFNKGILLLILSISILVLTSFLLHWEMNWVGLLAGFLVLFLLLLFHKSFR